MGFWALVTTVINTTKKLEINYMLCHFYLYYSNYMPWWAPGVVHLCICEVYSEAVVQAWVKQDVVSWWNSSTIQLELTITSFFCSFIYWSKGPAILQGNHLSRWPLLTSFRKIWMKSIKAVIRFRRAESSFVRKGL